MGIINDIKNDAVKTGSKVQSSESAKLEGILNKMFYLDKNIDEETKFVKQVMTRGSDTTERIGLHASAIIVSDKQFCVRQQVLSLLYKQLQGEQLPVSLMRIFAEGNAIHEKWQRLFIRAGYAKAKTLDYTRFDDDFKISYTPDVVCKIPEFYDGAMVVEIKSVNPFQFKKMASHPSGHKQLQWYMYLCQKAKGVLNTKSNDYKKGFVLCDDKGAQEFKTFVYDYEPETVAPFIERCESIQYYYNVFKEEHKMVPRHKECDSSTCKMAEKCPMRDACYNIGMGRVKI